MVAACSFPHYYRSEIPGSFFCRGVDSLCDSCVKLCDTGRASLLNLRYTGDRSYYALKVLIVIDVRNLRRCTYIKTIAAVLEKPVFELRNRAPRTPCT